VHGLVREAFLRGVSTRQVGEVLEPVLGESYSAQTVSRITRGLDQAVRAFHQRRLRDEYVYIFLDGVVLKVRDVQGEVRRRWVLVAYGITAQGRRELIAYQLARGESETSWTAFLQGLFLRGLEGRRLRLVITDGSSAACGRRWGWSGRRFPCNAVGRISCAISPTRYPRRKAPVCGRRRRCIRPAAAERPSGASGAGRGSGAPGVPGRSPAWNGTWRSC